jgi:PTS system D-glucosamine-specific IIC component
VSDVDCCATRLRVTVADSGKVNDAMLRQSGASGVVHKGNGIQVIYGPQVAVIKSNLVDYMESPASDAPAVAEAPAAAPAKKEKAPQGSVPAGPSARTCGHLGGHGGCVGRGLCSGVLGDGCGLSPPRANATPGGCHLGYTCSTPQCHRPGDRGRRRLLLHNRHRHRQAGWPDFRPMWKTDRRSREGRPANQLRHTSIKAAGYLVTTP